MKHEVVTEAVCLIYKCFTFCQAHYYSIHIINLLMLLWMYDYGCSQHLASLWSRMLSTPCLIMIADSLNTLPHYDHRCSQHLASLQSRMLSTPCLIPCAYLFYLTHGNKDILTDWWHGKSPQVRVLLPQCADVHIGEKLHTHKLSQQRATL